MNEGTKEIATAAAMPLETIISAVIARLRQGRFANEQSVSQGIVLPILNALGWDTSDTYIVWPEYQTGEGRADFAVCHPPGKPSVFIEVKAPGRAEDSVRQALDYAFHSGGVPMVILTDGKVWSFYLTMEKGTYEDRRVYKLDLFERSATEASGVFVKYLKRERIESGEAMNAAIEEYRNRNRRFEAQAAIPDAWLELINTGNEELLTMLADRVESKAGVRPEDDDVSNFLTSLCLAETPRKKISQPSSQTLASSPNVRLTGILQTPSISPSRTGMLILKGGSFPYANAKEAMVIVLTELAKADPSFLQRCAQHPNAQGRKRKYIAQSPDELYPDRPDLRDYREELPAGWFVATNLNNRLKKSIIELATEVAGLKLGKDVVVQF